MAGVSVDKAWENEFTLISNDFIDYYMPGANPAFLPIYIYLLRNSQGSMDTEEIADSFSMLESDVIKALKYWDKEGLIKYSQNESGISIGFIDPKKGLKAKEKQQKSAPVTETPVSKPPKYNPIELEVYKNDYKEIADLFEFAEHTLGKMLSDVELSTLYSFYEWLQMPVQVIMYLLEYCAQTGHRRMKYIESVALDWKESNIINVEAAKEYVNQFNKDYRQVLSALGISGRSPASKEMEYIDKWLKSWNMPIELVLEACDRTILSIGKAQFSYIDRILEGWHEAAATTIDDVKKIQAKFKEKTETKPEVEPKKEIPKRTNRFVNYEQHVRDYNEIEKLESEYLLSKLKGDADE